MKLKSYNGSIVKPTKVEGIVEARVKLNGKTHRLVDVAKDAKENITGLLFYFTYESDIFQPYEPTLLIGNLDTGVARNIINELLTNGVADVSGFDYQKETFDFNKLVFDEGASKPYYLKGFHATTGLNCFGTMPVCNMPVVDDEEEGSDDDEPKTAEDMRKEIYAMSDKYTITQLANMEETELADILKGLENF